MSDQGEGRPKATALFGSPDADSDPQERDKGPAKRPGGDTFLLHSGIPEAPTPERQTPLPAPVEELGDAPDRPGLSEGRSDYPLSPIAQEAPASFRSRSEAPGAPATSLSVASARAPVDTDSKRSPPDIPPYVYSELKRYVQDALGKFGAPGQLQVTTSEISLLGFGDPATYPLGEWLHNWPLMDDTSREKQATEIARRLAQQRAPQPSPIPERRLSVDLRLVTALFVVAATVIYLAFFDSSSPPAVANRESRGSEATSAETTSDEQVPKDSRTRSARVCASTRARVHQGGSVTVADIDGWVVEIALMKVPSRQRLDTHPALQQFVENPTAKNGSRYIWAGEPDLGSLDTSDTRVQVRASSVGGNDRDAAAGVTLTFGGTLVDPYFQETGRIRFHRIANALSEELEATHTGVYARCQEDTNHAMGSWFRGSNAGAATASVLYFMGMFATPRHLAAPFFRQPGEKHIDSHRAFRHITQGTKRIDRTSLATIVGSEGGMATGKPEGPVYITFPFRDGNRASRVSRSIARVASLAK